MGVEVHKNNRLEVGKNTVLYQILGQCEYYKGASIQKAKKNHL